jgi:retron-type reverse transcriptase
MRHEPNLLYFNIICRSHPFDSIPHAELVKSLSRRISDRHLLGLIKMWLVAPVEEIDERGRHHRTTRSKDEGRGSPQGSPITPPTMLRKRP